MTGVRRPAPIEDLDQNTLPEVSFLLGRKAFTVLMCLSGQVETPNLVRTGAG